jgi:SAM-dependent methyltransferase
MATEVRELFGQPVRGLLFGLVAESYERYRLDYSHDLLDTVLAYAGRPVHTALEVGAGTGKATRVFASRGIEVIALEPDPDMAAVLRKATRGLHVRLVVAPLEQFHAESPVDLVFAAASWHWTNAATRWTQAVELLVPGGVLALFGKPAELKDPDLFAAVEEIEKRLLSADNPAEVHPWSIEEMAAADGFTDVERRDLPSVATATAADFVGRLSTVSAYLMLGPRERAEALRKVRSVLPDRVAIDSTVQLSLARRV